MPTLVESKKNLSSYPLVTALSLFLMFGFGYVVKPWSTITVMGVKIIGIYFGVLIMLIFTKEMFWPPVLGLFALVFHGYGTSTVILQNFLGNSTVSMLFFILALCGALKDSGAPVVIANFLITRKITKGRPGVFIFMLFLAATLLAMLTTATTAILLMYQVVEGIMDACGYDKDGNEHKFMLMGIYIANIGGFMLPFKGVQLSTLAVAQGIMKSNGVTFNPMVYLIGCCITVLVFLVIYILFMKTIFHCNLEPLKQIDTSKLNVQGGGTKLNTQQAVYLGAFLFGVIFLLVQSFLPTNSPAYKFLSSFGTSWPWIVIVALLCIPHKKDGKSFMDGNKLIRDNAMWSTVCMIACISLCGQAISDEKYGIRGWLLTVFTPVFGKMSFLMIIFAVVLFCTVLTQFLNGSPVAYVLNTICIPFACAIEKAGGGSATAVCAAIVFCCFFAFITPAASSTAPLITGHPNMTSKFLWTKGWVYTGVWIVVATFAFYAVGLIIR